MKKFIATLLSLTLVSSVMVSFATVASADNTSLNVVSSITEYSKITDDTKAANTLAVAEKIAGVTGIDAITAAGAHVYLVETTVSDIGASITMDSNSGTGNGTALNMLCVEYRYDKGILYNDKAPSNKAGFATKFANTFNANVESTTAGMWYNFDKGTAVADMVPYASAYKDAVDNGVVDVAVDFDEATYGTVFVTDTDDFDVKVVVSGTLKKITADTVVANDPAERNWQDSASNVNYNETQNLSVAPAAPVDPEPSFKLDGTTVDASTGAAPKFTNEDGAAWGLVISDYDADANYTVKFTADGASDYTETVSLGGAELDGSTLKNVIILLTENLTNLKMFISKAAN